MTINDRIGLIMQEKNLTANEFAARLKVQSSNISHIITGRNKPSFTFLEKLVIEFPEISADWLIRGNGSMYITAQDGSEKLSVKDVNEPETVQNSLFDYLDKAEDIIREKMPEERQTIEEPESITVSVPITSSNLPVGKIKNIIVYFNNGSFEEFVPVNVTKV